MARWQKCRRAVWCYGLKAMPNGRRAVARQPALPFLFASHPNVPAPSPALPQPLNNRHISPRPDNGKIKRRLHAEPSISGSTKCLFKPHGHFRCDGTAAGDHIMKLLARHTQGLCCVGCAEPKLFKIIPHKPAGMGWGFHRHRDVSNLCGGW